MYVYMCVYVCVCLGFAVFGSFPLETKVVCLHLNWLVGCRVEMKTPNDDDDKRWGSKRRKLTFFFFKPTLYADTKQGRWERKREMWLEGELRVPMRVSLLSLVEATLLPLSLSLSLSPIQHYTRLVSHVCVITPGGNSVATSRVEMKM